MIFNRKKGKKSSTEGEGSRSINKTRQNAEPTKPVFNVPLSVALDNMPSTDGIPVVSLVRQCIDYVMDHGLDVEGIYRISASKNVLDEQERAVNFGEPITFDDAHEAANLLKRFLRGLPDHILTSNHVHEVERIANKCVCGSSDPCRCGVAARLSEFLSKNIPAANYYLLGYVCLHAQHVILHSDENKMTLSALGVLLQAILKLSKNEVRIFLLNASSLLLNNKDDEPITEIFASIPFERYTPLPRALAEDNVNNAVEAEIFRQESLLLDIREQLESIPDKNSPEAKEKERRINKIAQSINDLKQKVDGKSNQPSSSTSKNQIKVGPLPTTFLEKQLLAVHISLKQDIAEEKKKVAQLLTLLRNIQNEIPPELLESFEKPSPNTTETFTEEDSRQLDAKQTRLLTEVTYYRDLAAKLRGRYEQCSVILQQVKSNKELTPEILSAIAPSMSDEVEADKNGQSLLVTRF